jgi:AcrR family transcriptional regulator
MPNRKSQSLEAALKEAERQFSTRPYDDVSVNDIAMVAKCSTTTIYDAFGNKTGLYLAAAQSFLLRFWDGVVAKSSGATALERLVTLLEARAESFASFELREALRNLIVRLGGENLKGAPDARKMLIYQLETIAQMVQDSLDEGAFHDFQARVLTESIVACVDWRPIMHGMFFGSRDRLNYSPEQIVARTLAPLLTEAGTAAFEALRPGLLKAAIEAGPHDLLGVIKT